MSDWLVPFDDGLTQRLQCCTLCGRRPVMFWGICKIESQDLAMAYVLCQACRRQDPNNKAVEALLEQRYGQGAV
jgi:hypothetical protein